MQPDENVLADTSLTGTTVRGTTNQTNTAVSIRSDETPLDAGSPIRVSNREHGYDGPLANNCRKSLAP